MDADTEHILTFDHHTAIVSPFGASLRRYFVTDAGREWNAIWGYQGATHKRGGQGDVLIPFPSRVRGGVYEFRGQKHALVKNDKDGPNAIHGFVRGQLFETKKLSPNEAVFCYEIDARKKPIAGYPFSIGVQITYSVGVDGLTTNFQITNSGATHAPVGVGFHPYFCGDQGELADWQVTIPALDSIELEDLLPTGKILPVEGTRFDFRAGRLIGNASYNGCLAHLERDKSGWATALVTSKNSSRRISIRIDQAFDFVVIYTGDQISAPSARKGFAIEPMTCAPDAFHHAAWGLRSLAPGESMSGSYVIKAE